MTPRSRPRSHGIQPSLHARRVLSNLVAGPKGYVTEEYLARNALILSKVLPEPLKLVVDVGCGYGALATAIAVLTEARVVGFDVLEGRVRAVRDRPEAKDRVHVGIANVEAGLPIRKGVADLVIASEIIEHLYEPATLFEEASRVLRGGGRLVMTTPNSAALPYLALRVLPKRLANRVLGRWLQQNLHPEIVGGAHGHPDDHKREGFTVDELERGASAEGFETEHLYTYRIPAPDKMLGLLPHQVSSRLATLGAHPVPGGLELFAVFRKRQATSTPAPTAR